MPLLTNVRVLDLGTVVMAPYTSLWLADLGADVIKIEPPGGDSTRRTGPTSEADMSSMFLGLNRGKRSIVLDLKTQAARDSLFKLIESADIIIHSVRPKKMAKLGLGPSQVLARNPRIVYASLHGFGQGGPYGERPAYDDVIQGASGLAHLMSLQQGAPAYIPSIIADKTTGLIGAISILAGLAKRNATGKGVALEIPMFESMVAFNLVEHLYGSTFEPPQGPTYYPRLMTEYRRPYATRDGHVCILPYTDAHWRKFFEIAGAADHLSDPRFANIEVRGKNTQDLYKTAAQLVAQKSTQEWLALCAENDIPFSPVHSMSDLLEDEHLKTTEFFSVQEDAGLGRVRLAGVPVLIDGVRPNFAVAPRLGQHTREVLEAANVDAGLVDEIMLAQERGKGAKGGFAG